MGGAVIIGRLEGDDDVAVVGRGQTALRDGGAGDIPAQTFEFLSLM